MEERHFYYQQKLISLYTVIFNNIADFVTKHFLYINNLSSYSFAAFFFLCITIKFFGFITMAIYSGTQRNTQN